MRNYTTTMFAAVLTLLAIFLFSPHGGRAAVPAHASYGQAGFSSCNTTRHPKHCTVPVVPEHGRCYPTAKWSASQRRMPCVNVRRVEEDGSFIVSVRDGDGTVRYRMGVGVPNSYERTLK